MVDPNGNIPGFIINAVAPQRAFTIKDINKAIIKTGPSSSSGDGKN